MRMTKQLRVTTRTTSKLMKMQLIKEDVFKHPEGTTPTLIHLSTGINLNTIKTYLHEINDVKQKGYGGLWIPVGEKGDSPLKITEPKIHNEIITYQIPNYSRGHIEEDFDCGAIKYTFVIGRTSKQATLTRIAVDGIQIPVEIPTIMAVCEHFKYRIKNYTGSVPTDKEIIFELIEFNQTFENMKLNFGKCFTLETLNCMYKIYQKDIGVRVETKLKDITAETIFEFFRGNYKIIELENEIEKIVESQKNMENYLRYISKVLSPFFNQVAGDKKEIKFEETKKEIVEESYIKESSKITKKESKTIHNIFDVSSKPINDKIISDEKKPEEKVTDNKLDEKDIVYL